MVEDNNLTTQTDLTDASNIPAPQTNAAENDLIDLGTVPHSGVEKDDISKILEEIKLPERRDFVAQGDSKQTIKEPPAVTEVVSENDTLETNTPPLTKATRSIVMPLRTLRNDLQDVVRDSKMSMVKAVSLEQDKRRSGVIDDAVVKTKNSRQRTWTILFIIAVLFGLVAAAFFGIYIVTQKNNATNTTQQTQQSMQGILFAESTVGLPIDNTTQDSLKKMIVQGENSSKSTVGSITRIVPVVSTTTTNGSTVQIPLSLGDFLHALGAHPPDDLLRALDTTFFFGFHSVDKNSPVFVIPVISYDHAFAGMLEWEPAMNTELAPVFAAVPGLKTDENGLPVNRTFSDLVMNNYDVRALRDDAGTVQMYYSFPRPNILVIAESPYTFTEVLSRLQAARKL